METKLTRIPELSAKNPDMRFTSIGHLIDEELLEDCHKAMDGKKAAGIDGVTKDKYRERLKENLEDLVKRLKNKSYRSKPAKRVDIPNAMEGCVR